MDYKIDYNFNIDEAPQEIQNNIRNNGYFYKKDKDGNYNRDTNIETLLREIAKKNEQITILETQISELQLTTDEKDFMLDYAIGTQLKDKFTKEEEDKVKDLRDRYKQIKKLKKELGELL